jgi:hypothetical protein
MVDHPTTKTMIYQPRWLDLLLLRQWVINHNGWSSTDNCSSTTMVDHPPTKTMVYQPHWLDLLNRQCVINHNGRSSTYKDNGLLNTLVGSPPT